MANSHTTETMTTNTKHTDERVELIAKTLAKEFASFENWDAENCRQTPNGNEPHEERQYWRDVVSRTAALLADDAQREPPQCRNPSMCIKPDCGDLCADQQSVGRAELIAALRSIGPRDKNETCELTHRAAALLSDDKAVGDRFFLDHGMWHDRETGQHLFTQDEYDEGCRATVSEYKRRQDEDAHIQHPRNTPLHTRPQPQADDKKDAALKACVEAMQQVHIIGGQAAIDAAITQAQEALK